MEHLSAAQEGDFTHVWGPAVQFPGVQAILPGIGFMKVERFENRCDYSAYLLFCLSLPETSALSATYLF